MSKNYRTLFSLLKPIEPPPFLTHRIIQQIRSKQTWAMRARFIFMALGFAISMIMLVLGIGSAWSTAAESGFIEYVKLAGFNLGSLISYWDSYASILLETLPVSGLLLTFTSILILLILAKNLANYLSNSFRKPFHLSARCF